MSYSNSYTTYRDRTPTAPMKIPLRGARHPVGPKHKKALPVVATLVLFGILGVVCFSTVTSLCALIGTSSATGASNSQFVSTPQNSWHMGEVPALYQQDPLWAQEVYAEDTFDKTGCGPTCMAMVYVALTGTIDMTPPAMGDLAQRTGCATPDGTAWLFFTEGAAELGLSAQELPASEPDVRQALLSGSPVICSMGPGDFTTTGHFIVLTGIDERGNLIIRDPNSPERTTATWDFATVLTQCRAIWAYSAA